MSGQTPEPVALTTRQLVPPGHPSCQSPQLSWSEAQGRDDLQDPNQCLHPSCCWLPAADLCLLTLLGNQRPPSSPLWIWCPLVVAMGHYTETWASSYTPKREGTGVGAPLGQPPRKVLEQGGRGSLASTQHLL